MAMARRRLHILHRVGTADLLWETWRHRRYYVGSFNFGPSFWRSRVSFEQVDAL
jgi:hypothetical protein